MDKIEQLELMQLTLEYIEVIDTVAEKLPCSEEFKLKSQIKRAAVSTALHAAEAAKGTTYEEKLLCLKLALDSFAETVVCRQQIQANQYPVDSSLLRKARRQGKILSGKLFALRQAVHEQNLVDTGRTSMMFPSVKKF